MSDTPEDRQRAIMVALWKRMVEYMGQSWVREYGDVDGQAIYAWQGALTQFTEDQIARGVKACQLWTSSFPPTFGQFREMCLTKSYAPKTDQVVKSLPDLAKPRKGDSEIAKREKARMRRILAGEDMETKEESMARLKLHARWPGR